VTREGKDGIQVKLTINLDDLIINGNQSLNIPLQPRDIVTVPVDKIIQIYVWGEVKNPGALSVKLSKNITLMQAIAQAGGTTATAKKSAVVIKRKDENPNKGQPERYHQGENAGSSFEGGGCGVCAGELLVSMSP
jgi:polysaccharide export outer membrane protein